MIRAFNTIFSQACETPFFQGKITYGQPLQCGNPDYCVTDRSGREIDPVVVWELGTDVKTVHAHYYLTALGSAIASEISVLLSGSIPGLKPSDIFILTRKESEGRQIARFLRNAGLPFAFYKLNGLFQTPQAEHIRDILLAVQNPFDESKRMRAWMTPFFDVPIDQLSACKNLSENDPLVRNLFDWHVLARRRDFPALFSSIIKDSGLIRRIIFYQESERELTDYLHIFEMLLETAEEEGMELADLNQTLSDYMKDVRQPGREDGTIQRLETDKDAIQIMTMHKSKGLEAMVIFLYGGYGAAPPTDFLLYHEQDGKAVINFNGNEEHCQHARQESDDEDRRLLYVAVTRAKARLYLPFVPPEKYSRRVGMYRLLNDRLAELLGDEAALSKNGIVRQGLPAENTVTVRDDYNLGAFFSEKIDHITHLIDENIESQQFAELRTERAGFEITSYSRIKTLQAEHSAIEIEDGRILADRVAESTKTSLLSDMPSGLRFGNAFHLVMEKVNFSTIQQAKLIPAQWEVPDDLQELALYALSQEGFSHEHAPYLITLVYQALLSPVLLDDNKVPSRLTDVSVLSRELEFLYPYPGHQPLIDTVSFGKDVSTGEGFIKGFIDMVFRNQEKVFFCDWKTDIVHDYSSEYLLDYFQQHYALQANLYLGAICRMLQIRTEAAYEKQIGTAVYCFVRGMHPEYINRGVAIFRPSWRQLKNFEQELEHELHFAGRHQ
jgi:exodeoxyribonuclease V beta subunit